MFGLSVSEIVIVLVLALVVLGPQKLPEMARQLARFLGELRRVSDDMRRQFDEATREPAPPPTPHQLANPPVDTDAASNVAPPKIEAAADTYASGQPAPQPNCLQNAPAAPQVQTQDKPHG